MTTSLPCIGNKPLQARRPVLGYFYLLSLLLHALVLTLWQGEPPAGPAGHSSFEITVLARRGDVSGRSGKETGALQALPSPARHGKSTEDNGQRTSPDKKRSTASLRNTRAAEPVRPPAPEPVHFPAETPAPAASASPTQGATTHGQHELTHAARYRRVRAALREALLPRFQYPSIARRRGWEGRVTIGLHVEADGDLSNIHLLESSGHASLDKAAVKNVSELRNVPGATQWLDAKGMEVVLPVFYRLQQR